MCIHIYYLYNFCYTFENHSIMIASYKKKSPSAEHLTWIQAVIARCALECRETDENQESRETDENQEFRSEFFEEVCGWTH